MTGVLTNDPGALFQIQGTAGFNYQGGAPRFDNAGTFLPSSAGGTTSFYNIALNNYGTITLPVGILSLNAAYSEATNSVLNFPIGGKTVGTTMGQLQVPSGVTLNGNLNLTFTNGFTPAGNDAFSLVTAGAVHGQFLNFFYPSNRVTMVLSNTATSVIVTVTNVVPPRPQPILHLDSISRTTGRLYWFTNYPDYHLEYNTTLNSNTWAASGLTTVIVGTNLVATNSMSGPQKYYRLSSVSPPIATPQPTLKIQLISPGMIRLLWPVDDEHPFLLQSTANINLPNWTPLSNSPAILNSNNVVTNAISGSRQYFRLSSQ